MLDILSFQMGLKLTDTMIFMPQKFAGFYVAEPLCKDIQIRMLKINKSKYFKQMF